MKLPRTSLRVLFSVALLASALTLTAQNVQLRLSGGLASRFGSSSVGAWTLAVGYEHEFDQHFTFQPAIGVACRGWKDKDRRVPLFADDGTPLLADDGTPRTGLLGRTATAYYLDVPLLFNYYLRTDVGRYVVLSAGPYAALGLGGKCVTRGDAAQTAARKLYYDEPVFTAHARRFDAGAALGLGYQFPQHFTVGVEARAGLTPLTASGGHTRSLSVNVAYRF